MNSKALAFQIKPIPENRGTEQPKTRRNLWWLGSGPEFFRGCEMYYYLAWIIILSSIFTLVDTVRSWKRVEKGLVDIDDLRSLTGLIAKSEINHIFDYPDANGHYTVESSKILSSRTMNHRILDSFYTDMACFAAALISLFFHELYWLTIPAGLYIFIGWIYAIALIVKNHKEIVEEE